MKFVGRFSGVVAYADGSSDQFAAHLDERGIISVNAADESNTAILEVQNSNNWLENMLDLVSATLVLNPAGTAAKTVTSAAMHLSGRVARDNDTWEDFAAQYDISTGGVFVPNSSGDGNGSTTAYTEFLSATLTDWFGALVGNANVTI